ncbi:MAG: phosphodiester glycosidase family protein [Ilumatobacteraceae bacterium]
MVAAVIWVGAGAWMAVIALVVGRRSSRLGWSSASLTRVRRITLLAAIGCTAVVGGSLAADVVGDDDGAVAATANWARNNGLGWIVDQLERWRYSEPPSSEPADELAISPVFTVAPSTTSRPTTASPTTTPPTSSVPTTTEPPFAPSPLAPPVTPALEGEGVWSPVVGPGEPHMLWVTSMRPLVAARSVTATYVYIRPDRLRAAMYAGTELPGTAELTDGAEWERYARVAEVDRPSLVAAFNGGFRFEHIEGGYLSEGQKIEPLAAGEAAIAIDRAGRITIGEYGRDLVDDGTWESIRQTKPLLVDNGVSGTTGTRANAWGVDFGGVIYVFRSALCTLANGDLMYVSAGEVDAAMLADILIAAGCRMAMQLDINGTWPQFAVYDGFGTADRSGVLVDRRMSNANRYLSGSKKDFFALFLRT